MKTSCPLGRNTILQYDRTNCGVACLTKSRNKRFAALKSRGRTSLSSLTNNLSFPRCALYLSIAMLSQIFCCQGSHISPKCGLKYDSVQISHLHCQLLAVCNANCKALQTPCLPSSLSILMSSLAPLISHQGLVLSTLIDCNQAKRWRIETGGCLLLFLFLTLRNRVHPACLEVKLVIQNSLFMLIVGLKTAQRCIIALVCSQTCTVCNWYNYPVQLCLNISQNHTHYGSLVKVVYFCVCVLLMLLRMAHRP